MRGIQHRGPGSLPKTLPNSYIISSNGCKGLRDGLHFYTGGMLELGKRYAIEMLKLHRLEYKEAPTAQPVLAWRLATAPVAK